MLKQVDEPPVMLKTTTLMIRKSVHFLTGFLILLLTYYFDKDILLKLIIAGSVFSFITFNYSKFYVLHKTSGSSLGTLFYPLGVLSSFLVLYEQPVYYFRAALLVLTISDTFAFIAGQFPKIKVSFKILYDRKSLNGVIVFLVSTLLIFLFYLPSITDKDLSYIVFALILSVNMEVISFRGSDNLTIPLGLSLFFLISENHDLNYPWLLTIIIFTATGSFLLYKWSILNRAGSLSAYLLGVYFFIFPGIKWIIPIMAFFITSVLFTKLNTRLSKRKASSDSRNAWQVIANILWALLSSVMFLISQNEIFIYLFIAAMAAVTADTWASELGPLINKRSFSIADMKMHPAGITGGISPGGTMAALVASVAISTMSFYIFFEEFRILTISLLSISGFLACFADTFLGAFAEEKLMKCKFSKKIVNPTGQNQYLQSGLSEKNRKQQIRNIINYQQFMPSPNDIVNILGSATAPAFFFILSLLI